MPTAHPRISMARPPMRVPGFRSRLQQLYDAANHNRPEEVLGHLRGLVPEYAPTEPLVPALAGPAIYPDDY